MKIAIMQPYFFPYIGYFQLINSVDTFVIYDNIKFTKKGWINRNRILVNNNEDFMTLPLRRGSDFLNVNERYLSETWDIDRKKILNRIFESYKKAPQFENIYPLFESCLNKEEANLFAFIYNSLNQILTYLSITTKIIISSSIQIDHNLKSEDKVIAICEALKASIYINPIGGVELYSKERFNLNGIKLQFQKSNTISYEQYNNEFIPWLSILDVLMFNTRVDVKTFLNEYQLV
jgi:hypothetical protein